MQPLLPSIAQKCPLVQTVSAHSRPPHFRAAPEHWCRTRIDVVVVAMLGHSAG